MVPFREFVFLESQMLGGRYGELSESRGPVVRRPQCSPHRLLCCTPSQSRTLALLLVAAEWTLASFNQEWFCDSFFAQEAPALLCPLFLTERLFCLMPSTDTILNPHLPFMPRPRRSARSSDLSCDRGRCFFCAVLKDFLPQTWGQFWIITHLPMHDFCLHELILIYSSFLLSAQVLLRRDARLSHIVSDHTGLCFRLRHVLCRFHRVSVPVVVEFFFLSQLKTQRPLLVLDSTAKWGVNDA